jgi:hypothetical protein
MSVWIARRGLFVAQDASQGSGEEANQQDNSQNGSGQPSSRHEGDREYEFTGGETQLLRICMDAMHTAGLALIVQGVATGLLGEPSIDLSHVPLHQQGSASDARCGEQGNEVLTCMNCVTTAPLSPTWAQ